jgi:hypothetical protein
MGRAIDYALEQWSSPVLYLHAERLEIAGYFSDGVFPAEPAFCG